MKRIILLTLLLSIIPTLQASAGDSYAIRGARVHTLTGAPLENATVVVRAGKIEAVGTDVTIPKDATIIEAKGLEVYPGFFDAVSQLGLVEIESISATIDTNEVVPFNPHLMAASAINPQSEHIPVTRADGVTHALSAPSISGGTVIGGQAAVINLSGRVIDEMLIKRSAAMVLNWPTLQTGSFDFTTFSSESVHLAKSSKSMRRIFNR